MLIDVRTPEEYAAGHADGAINIEAGEIAAGNLGMLVDTDRNTLLELYCHSGARAEYVAGILQSFGFANVTNVGGLDAALRLHPKH